MHAPHFRPLDVESIRKDFPIFATTPPLAFLDNAASTQTPRPVVEAMDSYYDTYRSNIHRGIYRISEEATAQYERAREKVAQLVNAPRARQIIFTTEHDGIHQPRRLQLGQREHPGRRRNCPHGYGTP